MFFVDRACGNLHGITGEREMNHKKAVMFLTILFLFSAAGCSEDVAPKEKEVLLCGFEDWAPDFQLIKMMPDFGAVSRNTDSAYVWAGTSSACLRPTGRYLYASRPYLVLPTQSTLFSFNYADFSNVKNVTAKVYNNEKKEITLYMGLTFDAAYNELSPASEIVLKTGWNDVAYEVETAVLNLSYNITECYGVYFMFDNTHTLYAEEAPELYLDEVEISYNETETEIVDLVEFGEGEICDFEKLYQQYIVEVKSDKESVTPEVAVVSNGDWAVNATSGKKMLRVVTKSGDTHWGCWPTIGFSGKIFSRSAFHADPEHYEEYELCFDLYNNSSATNLFVLEFWTPTGIRILTINHYAYPGQWSNFRMPLKEIAGRLPLGYTLKDLTGAFRVAWPEYLPENGESSEEREFFFDNFRVEKI